MSPDAHSKVRPIFMVSYFRAKKCILRHSECFLAKSEESRPPLKWPILGGSTFFTFGQKSLYMAVLRNLFHPWDQKSAFSAKKWILSHSEGFLAKSEESRPPPKMAVEKPFKVRHPWRRLPIWHFNDVEIPKFKVVDQENTSIKQKNIYLR